MSVNSSFNSSNTSTDFLHHCFDSRSGIFIFTSFTVVSVFLLPLFILVLYVGYQRWRTQQRGSTTMMTTHSDIFTYNVIALELISFFGCCFYLFGIILNVRSITLVSIGVFSFTSPGQTMFHVLTCVERYLAVVHPVTYLGLRQAGGVRFRNISIGCVWLLCFAMLTLTKMLSRSSIFATNNSFLVLVLILVLFCNLSVLCVLIRPGPGKGGRDSERVDQTKQRAFHTITVIMGALLLRFVGILISSVTYYSTLTHALCVFASSAVWLTLPGSLVLPLLFLHRAGKLPGCK